MGCALCSESKLFQKVLLCFIKESTFAEVFSHQIMVYFPVNFICSSPGLSSSWSFGLLGVFELLGSLTENRRLL